MADEAKKDEIRIISNDGFAAVFHNFIDDERKTAYDLAVYTVLKRFANYNDGTCFPSLKTIANKAGIARSTVQKAINHLIELGYLEKVNVSGYNTSCTYTVHNKPTAYRETVCSVPPDGTPVYRETVPNEIHINDNHYKEEEGTPPPELIKDIKEYMSDILGNSVFHITDKDKDNLTTLLKSYDHNLVYNVFLKWTEKSSAKSKTDLKFFFDDFTSTLATLNKEKAKKSMNIIHEVPHCPECGNVLIGGDCTNEKCNNYFRKDESPEELEKALAEFHAWKEGLTA